MQPQRAPAYVARRASPWHLPNIRAGMWAWLLHRISGLALAFYIILHIIVISSANAGQASFDTMMERMHSPLFMTLDLLLLAAVLYHGLNGLRIILFDLGIGIKGQKSLFWIVFVVAAAGFLATAIATIPLLVHD